MTAFAQNLRPLSIAELFDRSFRLYRQNFGTFLGIVALTQLPLFAFQLILLMTQGATTADLAEFSDVLGEPVSFLAILHIIVSTLFTQIGAAALTRAISDNYLGRQVSTLSAFQRIGRSWLTLIFALMVAGLVIGATAVPFILVFFIPCIGQVVGFAGAVAVMLMGIVLTSLVTPVVVLEKKSAGEATRRAWELAKKRMGWILGYLILLGLFSTLTIDGPTILLQSLFNYLAGNANLMTQSIVQQTGNLLFSALFLPIELTAITLMYFDLRIRFEGFDLLVLAETGDSTLVDASDLTSKTSL